MHKVSIHDRFASSNSVENTRIWTRSLVETP